VSEKDPKTVSPAHYIIFHPEKKRHAVSVRAQSVIDGHLTDWAGEIWVDGPPGNEDPFVFHEPWLYSFCHATQLRRDPNEERDHVHVGSVLVFCCGQKADAGTLVVDTVFVVGRVERWLNGLPERYGIEREHQTDAWRRHFVFGTNGAHDGAFTYEGLGWERDVARHSFLPLAVSGRASIPIADLPKDIADRIADKLVGKRPVQLGNDEIEIVLTKLKERTAHHVVGCPIVAEESSTTSDDSTCC
jgi:hypothetical protein